MEKRRENVVMFPFMAQGHIIPFLALAQLLDQKGYSITFINTCFNIEKLEKSLPLEGASIKLVTIPFNPSDHHLPPEAENTDSLSYPLIRRFVEATPSLKLPFTNLLHHLIQNCQKPLCVISDFFFGWAADVAHELGIFHAVFNVSGGLGMACYYSLWLNLPHKDSENVEFLLPDFREAGEIHVSQVSPAMLMAGENDPMKNFLRKHFSMWANSDMLLINTLEEIDEIGLMYFRRKLGIPVMAIGPVLLPEDSRARIGKESTDKCISWLDKKRSNSVIYISFGSQNTISASQMMNLAKALEASGKNCIWVVRPPIEFDMLIKPDNNTRSRSQTTKCTK